jgi:hypothetical protein
LLNAAFAMAVVDLISHASCIIGYHAAQIDEIFHILQLLGAFAKLRKVTIAFRHIRLSGRLPVRMEQLGSHWTDFLAT